MVNFAFEKVMFADKAKLRVLHNTMEYISAFFEFLLNQDASIYDYPKKFVFSF